ncbi:MAG: 16S rRNA (guanine(966)-N(2))-methyltransferase RsmD [Clostridiaceae bacterium]|nr:16S rRNA (guanine(966)-N(2))-methyltransferase RsmD [Clostridiaceae bacterium]
MPRIITGKARGVKLVMPAGALCRPTPGRTKEALFSILAGRVEGARVLDVFAGSGQVALEALSRGAREAVMIENDHKALAAIAENIRPTKLEEGAVILAGDYRSQLKRLARQQDRFDIIYLDPPWRHAADLLRQKADLLFALLESSGMLIIETDGELLPQKLFDPVLSWLRSCQYGAGMLSFYQFKPD